MELEPDRDYEARCTRLTGLITLLWALDEIPGRPEKTVFSTFVAGERNTEVADPGTYRLSRAREASLAHNLAFLAGFDGDPDHVAAVAVEEDPDGCGLTVRVASNTGQVKELELGLDRIAGIFQEMAQSPSRVELVDSMLKAIVDFDHCRILKRLRSKHAPKSRYSGRTPLLKVLKETFDAIIPPAGALGDKVIAIRARANDLYSQFESFEISAPDSHVPPAQAALLSLVTGICKFLKDFELETVLNIPHAVPNPVTRESLPLNLAKLAHYHKVADYFMRMAKKPERSLFRNISVQGLSQEILDSEAPKCPDINAVDVLSQIVGRRANQQPQLLKHEPSVGLSTQRMFEDKLAQRRKNPANIHAEVQLLFHYERNPKLPRPRIIAASKSACFLCNLFFYAHGKFDMPGTHGRLWDKWTLPRMPQTSMNPPGVEDDLKIAAQSVMTRLEQEILQRITQTARRVRVYPTESDVPSLGSVSALGATLKASRTTTPLGAMQRVIESVTSTDDSSHQNKQTVVYSDDETPTLNHAMNQNSSDLVNQQSYSCITKKSVTSDIASLNHNELDILFTLNKEFSSRFLHLEGAQLLMTWDGTHGSGPYEACNVRIRKHHIAEHEELRERAKQECVNTNSMQFEEEIVLDRGAAYSENDLVLKIGRHYLAIKYSFDMVSRISGS